MLSRWKLPIAEFVWADVDGSIGRQIAGLMPVRREASGRLPVPGGDARYGWQEWQPFERLPRAISPPDGIIVSANGNAARLGRIQEVLDRAGPVSLDVMKGLQQDTVAWNAHRLVPLLELLRSDRPDVEAARVRLLQWDRQMNADSGEALLYAAWERELQRQLAARVAPNALVESLARRLSPQLLPALTTASGAGFGRLASSERDQLLLEGLAEAVTALARTPGVKREIIFAHPLGITPATAPRYNVGPFPLPGHPDTVFATAADRHRAVGPSFRMIADLSNWDLSLATNAPGQSGAPSSRHYRDLALLWTAGEYFPLAFSDGAIAANAESQLTLIPE
jgi:penicillin amidase